MADFQPITAYLKDLISSDAADAIDVKTTATVAPARKTHFPSLYTHMTALQSRGVIHDEGSDLEAVIKTYYLHSTDIQKLQIETILKSLRHKQTLLPKHMELEIALRFILNAEKNALHELASPQNFTDPSLHFTNGENAQNYYEIQFGKTREEQFYNYIKLFKMLPSEILRRSKLNADDTKFIDLKWLTRPFIKAYNKIERSPAGLTILNLAGRNLIFLPKNIRKLTALSTLNLKYNNFTKMPHEVCQFTNLTELNMSNNDITELPKHIFKLKNLQTLDLGYNPITKLPPGLGGFIDFTKMSSLHSIKIDSSAEKKFIVLLLRRCSNNSRVSNCIPVYIDLSTDGNTAKTFAEVFIKLLILEFILAFLLVGLTALIIPSSQSRR